MQEPWCFTPEQIAQLTPWQIDELYYKPAKEAEKRRETKSEEGQGMTTEVFENQDLRLDEFVDSMMAMFPPAEHPGSTREKWTADFRANEEYRIQREGR